MSGVIGGVGSRSGVVFRKQIVTRPESNFNCHFLLIGGGGGGGGCSPSSTAAGGGGAGGFL